jgi:putative ABC transport system substrate-binding protein
VRLRTIGLLATLALGILLAPLAAAAQPPTKVPRVGLLWTGSPPSAPSPFREAFRQGLRESGYVEGQNIALEDRWAEVRPERLPALAAELVRLKVDVIITTGDAPVRAAKQATTDFEKAFATITRDRPDALITPTCSCGLRRGSDAI